MNLFSKAFNFLKPDPEEQKRLRTERQDKFRDDLIDSMQKNAEYLESLPEEKRVQIHLFKIIFTIIFVPSFIAVFVGFFFGCLRWVLATEAFLALCGFILHKWPPKKVVYPSCFMMPVISFGLCLLISGVSYFGIGNDVMQWGYAHRAAQSEISVNAEAQNGGGTK